MDDGLDDREDESGAGAETVPGEDRSQDEERDRYERGRAGPDHGFRGGGSDAILAARPATVRGDDPARRSA